MATLTIHATNITGLGASQVVLSFLKGLDSLATQYTQVDCYVPSYGVVSSFEPQNENIRVHRFKRFGPNVISRILECLFPKFFFDIGDHLIVLGDVPLRVPTQQILFIHQAHLLNPKVNRFVGNSLKFRGMRIITRINAAFVSRVIVQTSAMASELKSSYPDWAARDCVRVVSQPKPEWSDLLHRGRVQRSLEGGLRLFYPADSYPHKNHRIFDMLTAENCKGIINEVVITLDSDQELIRKSLLNYVGRLNQEECIREYQMADALIFPSFIESYGLPLIEAMSVGIPIIVADLPYARALCGEEAIYFDPTSEESLIAACASLKMQLEKGWYPDWKPFLSNLPGNWKNVVSSFLKEFYD